MATVPLQSSHFDNACLFKVVQPQLFIFKIIHILNDFRQSVDDIYKIVSLIENKIDVFASIRKLGGNALFHHTDHEVWMWLVANFKHVIFGDLIESCCCSLEVVERVSHITLCGEDQSLVALILNFEAL